VDGRPSKAAVLVVAMALASTLLTAAPAHAAAPATVVLRVPANGDITYAVAQVKILKPAKGSKPPKGSLFGGTIGGVAMTARATTGNAKALRSAVKLHVVVSRVRNQPGNVRKIALFVVRPKGGRVTGAVPQTITVTIGNAKPLVASFWVRAVQRNGAADVFQVRNTFTTAVGNWSAYLAALDAKGARAAGMQAVNSNRSDIRPQVVNGRQRVAAIATEAPPRVVRASADSSAQGIWTGGDKADKRTRAAFDLLVASLIDRSDFQSAKQNPVVADFIRYVLRNPALATRWTGVVSQLPLVIPDKYASAAKEEKRFGVVSRVSISRAGVTIADTANSADKAYNEGAPGVLVNFVGTGSGRVRFTSVTHPASQPSRLEESHVDCTAKCFFAFAAADDRQHAFSDAYLRASPNSGSRFEYWRDAITNRCVDVVDMPYLCRFGVRDHLKIDAVFSLKSYSSTQGTYSNPQEIFVQGGGMGYPSYPSSIIATGLGGYAKRVTVTLHNAHWNHGEHAALLLVSPSGRHVNLLSGNGGPYPGDAASTMTFDDRAVATLPSPLADGTFHSTSNTGGTYASPAPAPPHEAGLDAFVGDNPNGTWQLFAQNLGTGPDVYVDGWSLAIETR
jgi:hypothetical protein